MRHAAAGAIFIALGLWGMSAWWATFGMVMRGLLPIALLVIGLLALLSSYYRMEVFDDEDDQEELEEG